MEANGPVGLNSLFTTYLSRSRCTEHYLVLLRNALSIYKIYVLKIEIMNICTIIYLVYTYKISPGLTINAFTEEWKFTKNIDRENWIGVHTNGQTCTVPYM